MYFRLGFHGLSIGIYQANPVPQRRSSPQRVIAVQMTWSKTGPSPLFGAFHSYKEARLHYSLTALVH